MTRDDIIRMAREAGFHTKCFVKDEVLLVAKHSNGSWIGLDEELERFAQLVRKDYSTAHANLWLDRIHKFVLAEREACAKVADELHLDYAHDIAEEIRARGQQ